LDLLKALNEEHLAARPGDGQLEATIESMEIAYRMQTEGPEVFDLAKETPATRERYGDSAFGRGCLMARRMVEKGVRMVQIYFGNSQPWDSHEDIQSHARLARQADPAVAALVQDLEERGLFNETLVVVGTEFGRTPAVETGSTTKLHNGRDHNSLGYSILLAGGGVKGGYVHGATDEFGYKAVDKPVHPTRPQRDPAPPHGPRPHQADLLLQRPPLPAHRRPRRTNSGHPGLVRLAAAPAPPAPSRSAAKSPEPHPLPADRRSGARPANSVTFRHKIAEAPNHFRLTDVYGARPAGSAKFRNEIAEAPCHFQPPTPQGERIRPILA
jgi:hypothetical protein